MLKKPIIIILILVILVIVIFIAFWGYRHYSENQISSKYKLPHPLGNVTFPSEKIQYPSDWPNELKFPKDFMLVDSTSGLLPGASTKGFSAKLRYKGIPFEAEKIISSFFKDNKWSIVETDKLDSGGFSLLIQHNNKGNGIIVIDADPNNSLQTIIIATIFP